MKSSTRTFFACLLSSCPLAFWVGAADRDTRPVQAERMLTESAWAQQAGAQFDIAADDVTPAPPPPAANAAGLAGTGVQGAPRWDGQPGRLDRMGTPTLNVLIRWDSAAPVREALRDRGEPAPTDDQVAKDYIVTIIGLVPSNRYRATGSTAASSSSDDAPDLRNPEPMLEALMTNASIRVKEHLVAPENVRIEQNGALHLYFPRTTGINLSDKEVTVAVRFGGISVNKRFRLKNMRYKGGLEL